MCFSIKKHFGWTGNVKIVILKELIIVLINLKMYFVYFNLCVLNTAWKMFLHIQSLDTDNC